MANVRTIDYGKMLYETLRNYFSINANSEVSILFKFMAALVMPLQNPFNDYVTFRTKEMIIASCKWQIAQLTNVLNFLYDNLLKRVFITQAQIIPTSVTMFEYPPTADLREFGELPPGLFVVEFTDRTLQTLVTINVPVSVDLPDLTAAVNQIRIQGIPFQIQTF